MQSKLLDFTQLDLFGDDFPVPEDKSKNKTEDSIIFKKYGINKLNNLNKLEQNSQTDIWSLFHQIAQFIYLNGKWAWKDYLEAAKFMYPFLGFLTGVDSPDELGSKPVKDVISLSKNEIQKLGLLAGRYSTYNYAFKFVLKKYDGKRHYLVLTDDFSKLEQSTTIFFYGNKATAKYNFTYISMSLLIGYSRLIEDILNTYVKDKAFLHGVDSRSFWELLTGLVAGKRSVNYLRYKQYVKDFSWMNPESLKLAEVFAEKYGHRFNDLENYPKISAYVKDYLVKTYNEILMQKRKSKIISMCNTKSWNNREALNPSVLSYLYSSPLRKYFGVMMFDNNVSMKNLHMLEDSLIDLMKILPKGKVAPALRLKDISITNKLGIYLEVQNQIVIDMRRKNIENQWHDGINYYLHEYGHYLDYQFTDSHTPLSMQKEFALILKNLSLYLKSHREPDGKYIRNHSLDTPTEVFARAFELYLNNSGLETSAMHNETMYLRPEYTVIANSCNELINNYFDNLFPNLKSVIRNSPKKKLA